MQQEKLIQTLHWLEAIGVDEPIALEPFDKTVSLDQLLRKSHEQNEKPDRKSALKEKQSALGASTAVLEAKKIAASCADLAALRGAVEAFDSCPLKATASNLVFGYGDCDSDVLIVGDTPSADEDREGVPFVGEEGRFFCSILKHIGLKSEQQYYLTNVINWRPPGGRTPSDSEMTMMEPFLQRHIELVKPKVILFVGSFTAKFCLKETQSISKLRGRWFDYSYEGGSAKARVVLHPADIVRQAIAKKRTWQDLIEVKKLLTHE